MSGAKSDEPRVNRAIRAPKVRLVDEEGEMLGVMSVQDALERAQEVGLDLVEISPNAAPPVCKMLDYGKYKYNLQKRASEARKKQKIITVKEVKLRPGIDKHDLDVKLRHVREFLANGDKVKISLRFRGREMSHQQIGYQLLQNVKLLLGELIRVEQEPALEGRQLIMMIAPAKSA